MWRVLRPDATAVLSDKLARKSLARYLAVMENEKAAKFQIARKIEAEFNPKDSTRELWQKHAELTRKFYTFEKQLDTRQENLENTSPPEKSYLDLKIHIAKRILEDCHFCSRRCRVNRIKGELGYCKCGTEITVSSIFQHMGEEPELVPSGTIFTIGCTMRCRHCQNWTISQWIEKGEVYKPEKLAKQVEQLRRNGSRNVNLVGGEPTPWLEQWLETFKYVDKNIPIVWNSNSYYSPKTAQLLAGFADVYLLDYKYGPNGCAEKISDAIGYWKACTYNHLEAKKHGELIIRLLVLPRHLDCCTKPIMKWIAKNLGTETRVNIMFQYRPEWQAYEIPELRRRLTTHEKERVIELARESNMRNFIT